jgi:hypothetical protein
MGFLIIMMEQMGAQEEKSDEEGQEDVKVVKNFKNKELKKGREIVHGISQKAGPRLFL